MFNLQQVVSGPLDMLRDLVAVGRPKQQGPQDQHVQRALKQLDSLGEFVRCRHSRHSTQNPSKPGRRSTIDFRLAENGQRRSGEYRRAAHTALNTAALAP